MEESEDGTDGNGSGKGKGNPNGTRMVDQTNANHTCVDPLDLSKISGDIYDIDWNNDKDIQKESADRGYKSDF
jgi:hypothetical protein